MMRKWDSPTSKRVKLVLQLVEIVGQVGEGIFQPLSLAGFGDHDPWLCGGVFGVAGEDLPVVKHTLGERLASGIGS